MIFFRGAEETSEIVGVVRREVHCIVRRPVSRRKGEEMERSWYSFEWSWEGKGQHSSYRHVSMIHGGTLSFVELVRRRRGQTVDTTPKRHIDYVLGVKEGRCTPAGSC